MTSSSNTTYTNFLLAATLSSSVVSLYCYLSEDYIPQSDHVIQYESSIEDWKDSAFNVTPDYLKISNDIANYQTILEFSQKLIENSTNVESDFVDIVNENFWDLI